MRFKMSIFTVAISMHSKIIAKNDAHHYQNIYSSLLLKHLNNFTMIIKKSITIIACLCLTCICSIKVSGQNTQFKNVFKISPVQFANSTFQINYERFFKEKKYSLVVSPAILLKQNTPESLIGFKGNIQYRFYFTHLHKETHKTWIFSNLAFYGGGYAQYLIANEAYWASYPDNNFNYITDIFKKEINSIEGGVLLGIQIDIIPRLVLDFYFGGGIKYSDVVDSFTPLTDNQYPYTYGVLDREYTGVVPRGGLKFGFNF